MPRRSADGLNDRAGQLSLQPLGSDLMRCEHIRGRLSGPQTARLVPRRHRADIVARIREVLRMSDDINRSAEALKALALEVREHDRRLIRLETMVEVAQGRPGTRRARAIESKRRPER